MGRVAGEGGPEPDQGGDVSPLDRVGGALGAAGCAAGSGPTHSMPMSRLAGSGPGGGCRSRCGRGRRRSPGSRDAEQRREAAAGAGVAGGTGAVTGDRRSTGRGTRG